MDPKDFPWTEDQQVTVTNPTSELFKFKVHNKEYQLEAGRTAKMPGYMAWLYVYGQSVKAAQADKAFARWNEEGFRPEYYSRFYVGIDEIMQQVQVQEVSPMQLLDDEPAKDVKANGRTAKV